MTFIPLYVLAARFYPTLVPPMPSSPAIASPTSTDGTGIDAVAALNSYSARAAAGPEGNFMPSSPFLSKLSATPGSTSSNRRAHAPRVMGRIDHAVPPMPSVRFFARSVRHHGRPRLINVMGWVLLTIAKSSLPWS